MKHLVLVFFTIHVLIAVCAHTQPLTRDSYILAAEKALPYVVTVNIRKITEENGNGSGFIVSASGHVATNKHVVEGQLTNIEIVLSDGTKYPAELVGKGPDTDVAILKINQNGNKMGFVKAPVRSLDSLHTGEIVMAIGAPSGLRNSLSAGVVSAIRPSSEANNIYPHDLIQTDAAINGGNSGGPLIDLDGNVLGMNTFNLTRSGDSAGLGFAIPVGIVMTIYEQLAVGAQLGWIGISAEDLDETTRAAFRIPQELGCVLITGVIPGGPADTSGIKQGDCIVGIIDSVTDSTPTNQKADELLWQIRNSRPGDGLILLMYRADVQMTVSVSVHKRPE